MTQDTAQILKVRINSIPMDLLLSQILTFVAKSRPGKKLVIFTPNPEFLVAASREQAFRHLLNQSDINLPDGFGLIWLAKLVGQPLKKRVSGADLVERLLTAADRRKWVVGISGARRGVEEEVDLLIKRLGKRYPGLTLVNLDDAQFKIGNLKLQIVFACQGMGKQEQWIWENKDKIKARVFMGIGGSLDFLTGFSRRAPRWMQTVGLEWLWRVLQRPGHLKRVWTAIVVFPYLVIKEKLEQKF